MKYNVEKSSCGKFATRTANARAVKPLGSRPSGVKLLRIAEALTPPNDKLEKDDMWAMLILKR
jgi:hypothetical protein